MQHYCKHMRILQTNSSTTPLPLIKINRNCDSVICVRIFDEPFDYASFNKKKTWKTGGNFAHDIFKTSSKINILGFEVISLRKGPTANISALVQLIALDRTVAKPLHETMMTRFNDSQMRHHFI